MKKNIYLLLAGFAAMAMATSCSDNELVGNDASTSNQPKTITINASAAEGSDSRVAYSESGTTIACTWQSTDTIYLSTSAQIDATGTNKVPSSTVFSYNGAGSDIHHASFKGTFATEPAANDALYALVAQKNTTVMKVGSTGTVGATTKFQGQDGTLEGAESRNLLIASTTYKGDSTKITFGYKFAILKLGITLPSSVAANSDAQVILKGTGLKKAVKLNPKDFTENESSLGDVVANVKLTGGTKKNVYLCVAPAVVTGLNVEVVVGTKSYAYTIGDKTIAAGKAYSKTVDLSSVTPTNYVFIKNFSEFIYGGDDANMLSGFRPYYNDTTKIYEENKLLNCGYSDDTGELFTYMTADFRTSRNISTDKGWAGKDIYEHPGFVKFGTTKRVGVFTIPAFASLTSAKNVTVTFDAMAYDGNTSGVTKVNVATFVGTDSTAVATIELPARTSQKMGVWQHYSYNITGASSSMTLKIQGVYTTNLVRFLLTNIRVKEQ